MILSQVLFSFGSQTFILSLSNQIIILQQLDTLIIEGVLSHSHDTSVWLLVLVKTVLCLGWVLFRLANAELGSED